MWYGFLLCNQEGDDMRIEQLLDQDTRAQLNRIRKRLPAKPQSYTKTKPKKKVHRNRKLSAYDIRELMGTNRQTYKRVGGKVKRR